jgi:hypothetical protein
MSSIPVPDERTLYSSQGRAGVDALAWPFRDVLRYRVGTDRRMDPCHTYDASTMSASPSKTLTP